MADQDAHISEIDEMTTCEACGDTYLYWQEDNHRSICSKKDIK